jgi:hypothetical protein
MLLPYAHALVARQDLPIPAWLFAWGASIVLIASFFALSVAWREPRFEDDRWRPYGAGLSRALFGAPLQVVCGAIGVFLLGLTVYAGFKGTTAPDRNFAITFVFVTAWLGFPVLSVLLGDVFRPFNPWRAIGRAAGSVFRAAAGQAPRHLPYPERLGRWPAAVGLVAFVWLEIVYGPSGGIAVALSPDDAAVAALLYSGYTLAMMGLFGVERWCERGEVFSVYFGMFASLGAFAAREGRFGMRKPLSAAGRWAVVPASAALVIASLGTTVFDGAQEGGLEGPMESVGEWLVDLGLSEIAATRIADTAFILLCIGAIALVYELGVRGMASVRGAPPLGRLRSAFAHTLIPIRLPGAGAVHLPALRSARRRRRPLRHRRQRHRLPRPQRQRDLVRPGGRPGRGPRDRARPRPRPRDRPLGRLPPGGPFPVLDAGGDGGLHLPGALPALGG